MTLVSHLSRILFKSENWHSVYFLVLLSKFSNVIKQLMVHVISITAINYINIPQKKTNKGQTNNFRIQA